ncbi:hypothetical protein KSP40_PGU013410 [Platanthera guangdongensis]|uniref:Phytocyanin domain-containing protein n=1 Tax=Platanthera guangdongensis TaxID=2320717 RepID=A0ABR2MDA8_9ASPA
MASLMKLVFVVVVLVILAGKSASAAKVYTVGDSIGWTILNNPNYTAWVSGKTFHAGDTIVFKYNKQFHNVLEVTKADYAACKNGSPLAEYTTGDDSITLKTAGHHYFICGVPGHCQLGQKVDISTVGGKASAPTPAPSGAPSTVPGAAPGFAPTANPPALNAGTCLPALLPLITGPVIAARVLLYL